MEIIITAVGRDAQFSPPREFFERPAVPFIVFHLLDTVQSIHASLKISSLPPPPPPSLHSRAIHEFKTIPSDPIFWNRCWSSNLIS